MHTSSNNTVRLMNLDSTYCKRAQLLLNLEFIQVCRLTVFFLELGDTWTSYGSIYFYSFSLMNILFNWSCRKNWRKKSPHWIKNWTRYVYLWEKKIGNSELREILEFHTNHRRTIEKIVIMKIFSWRYFGNVWFPCNKDIPSIVDKYVQRKRLDSKSLD